MRRIRDIASWRCGPEDAVRTLMSRFNELPAPFAIVLDAGGHVVGTVTDGDVRRALLGGRTLESLVSEVMNPNPFVGSLAEPDGALERLETVRFVPLVDESGVVQEIWVAQAAAASGTAVVMAGGYGKRLGAHTAGRPKPLLEVGQKPIMEHVLSWLEGAGLARIYVSTHYLADQVVRFLEERQTRTATEVLYEPESLGTAGSLAMLPDDVSGPVFVVNADVITKLDLQALASFHRVHGYDATVAVFPHQVAVPFGVVQQDSEGLFAGIEEKPTYTYFEAAGIYVLEPDLCRMVTPQTRIDMPDLLNRAAGAGKRVGLFPIHEYWIDVGRPDDLAEAQRHHAAAG